MKYCDNCGKELDKIFNFCPNCGREFSIKNQKSNSGSIIVCAIIGLLFPIVGAILYYVLKRTDMRAAKAANICSWIGFLGYFIYLLIYGVTIFNFL